MKCRVCKCSHREPCNPPCAWESAGLCTNCADAIRAILAWRDAAVQPSTAALLREVKAVEGMR